MKLRSDTEGLTQPRDEQTGRYAEKLPCDGCGKSCIGEHFTDDEVVGKFYNGGDGPGFFLCNRKRCIAARPKSVDARHEFYTRQREINDKK